MEPNPEREQDLGRNRIEVTVISPGVLACAAGAGAENEVVALLAFVGNLTNYSARITFNLWDEPQTLTGEELKMPDDPDPLDYDKFLRGKAHDLICATNFRLNFHGVPAETEREKTETVLIES